MTSRRRLDWLLWTIFLISILRLWIIPLPSSFWVDEMGTMFVVRYGAGHPSLAVAPQVPESLYFWLPRLADALLQLLPAAWRVPGVTETAYRVPSLLAMAGACFVIGRLAKRLIHPRAAWLAVFACLSLRGFNYQAADARPYAFGTLIAVTGIWALVRWMDTARTRDALLFIVLAALLWRVHLVYWPFYAVFAIYAAFRIARRGTQVNALRAVSVFAVLALALLPTFFEAFSLFRQAGAHVIVRAPGMSELWRSLKIGLIAECAAGAWLLGRWREARRNSNPRPSSRILLASWWLVQPLGLFAFSWLTGNSVFVDRYLSIALPGAALVAAAIAAPLLSEPLLKPAAAILGACVLLFLGEWQIAWPAHHNSNWRAAAQAVNLLQSASTLPVICPSAFIEARPPVWTPNYPLPGFLYAPLAGYPIQGKLILFPFETSPAAERFAARVHPDSPFILYGPLGPVNFWEKWFIAQPSFAGWRAGGAGDFGDVGVVLIEPSSARRN